MMSLMVWCIVGTRAPAAIMMAYAEKCMSGVLQRKRAHTEILQWRHNGHHGVSNHQPHDCLLNRLFRRRWRKTWKLHVTGLCAGNSPVTGEFPTQMASYAENDSIWCRHHGYVYFVFNLSTPRKTTQRAFDRFGSVYESLRFWLIYEILPSALQ